MRKETRGEPARPGDEIVVTAHSVGQAPRKGVILEVLGAGGHDRFRVRWDDDHESIFSPAEDAVISHPATRSKRKKTA